jgi:L,D-transpeptidase catalytic domain
MARRLLAASVAAVCAIGLSVSVSVADGATSPRPQPAASVPQPPTPKLAWVGRVLLPVAARGAPRRSARVRTVVQPIAPLGGGPTVLLITRSVVRNGTRWAEVLLPVRPNGVRGWVPAGVLRTWTTQLRIVIDITDRRLTLFRANRPIVRAPIAVGKPGTETPRNEDFAIAEMIRTRTPGAFLGPIVFPITGYSERLNEFAGGNGRVAIHGTSLPELIGTAASNGCIRMRNRDVVRMSRLVRAGTPLKIRT